LPSDWFDGVTPGDIWAAVLALIMIGSVALTVVKVIHPLATKITRVLDLFLGRPAEQGIPAVPGVIERLDAQDAQIAAIQEQVTPNRGSTTKLSEDVRALDAKLTELLQRFEDHLHHQPSTPRRGDSAMPADPDEDRILSPEVEPEDADNPEPEADEAEPVEEA